MKPKILVSRKISDLAEEKLQKEFEVTLNPKDEPIPESELIKLVNDYDGMISTGFDKISENFFKNLNGKLKIIAQVGFGYDNISIKSAEEKKIKVTNTPNVLNEAVAETTILLILAASRRIGEAYNLVRTDNWKNQKPDLTKFMIGNSVTGKTLGIIGMGRIGRMAAKCAKAFGMNVIAWSHNLKQEDCEKVGVEYVNSTDLFKMSDILTIHTRLSDRTRGYIDKNNLKLMKKGSVIVNTSRGPIIKEHDLITALNNNIISCAALDVYDQEPLPRDHILRKTKNLILTPHIEHTLEQALEFIEDDELVEVTPSSIRLRKK